MVVLIVQFLNMMYNNATNLWPGEGGTVDNYCSNVSRITSCCLLNIKAEKNANMTQLPVSNKVESRLNNEHINRAVSSCLGLRQKSF